MSSSGVSSEILGRETGPRCGDLSERPRRTGASLNGEPEFGRVVIDPGQRELSRDGFDVPDNDRQKQE